MNDRKRAPKGTGASAPFSFHDPTAKRRRRAPVNRCPFYSADRPRKGAEGRRCIGALCAPRSDHERAPMSA
eukprot:890352-Pyramimonas_sp.AAC.1